MHKINSKKEKKGGKVPNGEKQKLYQFYLPPLTTFKEQVSACKLL